MKRSYLSFFSVLFFITVSCQNDVIAPLELTKSNEDASLVIPFEKIPVEKVTLSEKDAVLVASLFTQSELSTKSFTNKQIKDVVSINDAEGNPAIYAVNFTDGYILVSATKNYYPVLAEVEQGSFNLQSDTGQDIIVEELLQSIEYVNSHPEEQVNRVLWLPYEQNRSLLKTKANDDFYDFLEENYLDDWYADGRNVYYLYDKPENMPDDLYQEFCQRAMEDMAEVDGYPYMQCAIITEKLAGTYSKVGPLIQTHWGQGYPYNSEDPYSRNLGCVTIAIAQIMRYYGFPYEYNWSQMPNDTSNTELSSFLFDLRGYLNIDNDGDGYIENGLNYLRSKGYGCNYLTHNIQSVIASILRQEPVIMIGSDAQRGFIGHAWICDGYIKVCPVTEYTLYLLTFDNGEPDTMEQFIVNSTYYPEYDTFYMHMNWGWGGIYDGYFLEGDIENPNYNYTSFRKDAFISLP